MISESLARRYAVALFKLAVGRKILEDVTEEFSAVNEIVASKPNFRYFLYSPKVNIEEKKRILSEIFADRISKSMLHFLFLLLDKKRQTLFETIFGQFMTMYNNYHDRATVTVRPAAELNDDILEEIRKDLEKILKKNIIVEQKVTPPLIGGLQVRVQNTVYDASVSGKLHRLKKQLTA